MRISGFKNYNIYYDESYANPKPKTNTQNMSSYEATINKLMSSP